MNNFETAKLLIQEMSGTGERTLAVSKSFLEFTGSLEGGVFLSQVIYFSDKSKRKDGYFYKSYEDWKQHTFMTEYSLRKQVKELKEKGYLETALKKANNAPTLHYKFNMENFTQDFISFLRKQSLDSSISKNGFFENDESLTKSTTKITTNNNIPSDKSEVDKVLEKYKELENLPKFNKVTPVRKKAINARLREEGLDKVIAVLEELNKDDYYVKAKADGLNWYKFDYVFNPTKFNMLIERFEKNNYNNYNTTTTSSATQYEAVNVNDLFRDC